MDTCLIDGCLFSNIFEIGAQIATPLGLLGFAIAAYLVWSTTKSRHESKQLEMLPEEERVKIVDEWLTRYGIDGTNLTREEKSELIREEMHKRFAAKRLTLIVVAAVCLSCFAIAAFAVIKANADAAEGETEEAVQIAKVKSDADALEKEKHALEAELKELQPLLATMVTDLSEKGPLRGRLETFANVGTENDWSEILQLIDDLEESSTRIDELMKETTGGFKYKQLKTYAALTKAMKDKRIAFEILKDISFPPSEDEVKKVVDATKKMDALQDVIQDAQAELAAYMTKLHDS